MIGTTPLMAQYLSIKQQYPNTLLLFSVGDFYETFAEDAIVTSKILGIVLTKKPMGSSLTVELAGFPRHALDLYLPKLVKAGHRVAICDQMEDPKQAKGLVKRGVTELVTPGLTYNDIVLDQKKNNYLASVYFDKKEVGIAFLDLSTGEFSLAQGVPTYIQNLIQSLTPAEVIISKEQQHLWQDLTKQPLYSNILDDWIFQSDYAHRLLLDHFKTTSLRGFGIDTSTIGIIAAGAILHYLKDTEHTEISHIRSITNIKEQQYLSLDAFTIRALELIEPQHMGGTSLFEILDGTVTPMGTRLLKKWILFPLKNVQDIQNRLDIVEYFIQHEPLRKELALYLNKIGDLERLISKVATCRINPREMVGLKESLLPVQPIKTLLQNTTSSLLQNMQQALDACHGLVTTIQSTLVEHPPIQHNQGGLIKANVDAALDELHTIMHDGQTYLIQLQQQEIQKTHIPSLKISYNRVFGYYFEVPNTHKDKVPKCWIRKQTLANAERFVTEELKNYEEKILHASDRAKVLEHQLYQSVVLKAKSFIDNIQKNAHIIAQLDCLLALAKQAYEKQYCKPIIDKSTVLDLRDNRHPVIEQRLPLDATYVANDIFLDQEEQQIIIITGPNMAGKSALLRQVALTVLMAQMGSFVPATYARIGLIDKIFTRVGAYDNVSKGESTFMVEMIETANIMHNLSDRSLVLMDEIGRGTSTYDGISIAWSLVEYLHNHPKYRAKTLFATHYHELNAIDSTLPRVKNYKVTVQEASNKVLFLYKLKSGSSEHSFGIHVAQMAGLPSPIIERATNLLNILSNKRNTITTPPSTTQIESTAPKDALQKPANCNCSRLKALLEKLDINQLTPIEALSMLNEIKLNSQNKI